MKKSDVDWASLRSKAPLLYFFRYVCQSTSPSPMKILWCTLPLAFASSLQRRSPQPASPTFYSSQSMIWGGRTLRSHSPRNLHESTPSTERPTQSDQPSDSRPSMLSHRMSCTARQGSPYLGQTARARGSLSPSPRAPYRGATQSLQGIEREDVEGKKAAV